MEPSRTATKGPRRRRAPVVPSHPNVVVSDPTGRERRSRGQAEQPRKAEETYARDNVPSAANELRFGLSNKLS
ncbi:hypothetical protein MA16_Dca027209 [Dendrobium catenatum]|uniref:Uncharacterized protein n=1 Tax=Dendrobium catenatum TaxID=906689 RepID=A0A2I0VE13_9ASPA|nr:hypothetical protein MA16_Dca027209 [Dendrobium catenatum]